MPDASVIEIGLHDIHEMSHLSEDEDPMVEPFEFGEDAVNELEFARGSDDPLMVADVIIVFEKEVGVVTAFPQLHHQIGQRSFADFAGVVGELQSGLA